MAEGAMTKNDKLNKFLTRLEKDKKVRSFVAIMSAKSKPWVNKYAWVGESWCGNPKETPSSGDRLYVAARNLSLSRQEVIFECSAEVGKVLFDKQDGDNVYIEKFFAPPATMKGDRVPIDQSTTVDVSELAADRETIFVKAKSEDLQGKQSEDECDEIVLRFGDG